MAVLYLLIFRNLLCYTQITLEKNRTTVVDVEQVGSSAKTNAAPAASAARSGFRME
jgi:hypothetical protein